MDPITIELARRGDREAQSRVLRGLQDLLYRFCCSQLFDRDSASDATQETALRLLRLLPSYRGESKLETWAIGIALNVCREMRRQKRWTADLADVPAEASGAHGGERAGVEQTDAIARMRLLLAALPDRQREAITLRFLESQSVEETAVSMNCAEGTVKATVHQALKALRRKLQGLT